MTRDNASLSRLERDGAYNVSSNCKKLPHPVRAVEFLLAEKALQTHTLREESIEERGKAFERIGIEAQRHGQRDGWSAIRRIVRERIAVLVPDEVSGRHSVHTDQ